MEPSSPICIFKGMRLKLGEQIPPDIDKLKKPAILVYDSFKGHLDDSVKAKFRKSGFDLAIIPSGLTSICQLLDVAINKPFKDYLRKNGSFGCQKIVLEKLLKEIFVVLKLMRIKRSRERISEEIIIKSFKTCRIVDESGDKSNDLEIIDLCDKEKIIKTMMKIILKTI
ncbi:10735_t:CDS:2 [Gigaspora rosea]|nr:10735_t:CDS:2 [Gigaspora rosea]